MNKLEWYRSAKKMTIDKLRAMAEQDLIDIKMGFTPWQKGNEFFSDDVQLNTANDFSNIMWSIDIVDRAIEIATTEINDG